MTQELMSLIWLAGCIIGDDVGFLSFMQCRCWLCQIALILQLI